MEIKRAPFGIQGLDEMLHGGLVFGRSVLMTGGPGAGKTSFAYHFLFKGAEQFGEKGLFVSLEQPVERVVEGAKRLFQWDWDSAIAEEKLVFTRIQRDDFNGLAQLIEGYVEQNEIRRVAIDNTALLRLFYRGEDAFRNHLYELIDSLATLECTTLLLSEKSYTKRGEASYGIEEFIADGVINLYLVPKETTRLRVLEITKMRDTKHSMNLVPFQITPQGIEVSPSAGLFTEVE